MGENAWYRTVRIGRLKLTLSKGERRRFHISRRVYIIGLYALLISWGKPGSKLWEGPGDKGGDQLYDCREP